MIQTGDDGLDVALRKLQGGKSRIPPDLRIMLQEKFPKQNSAHMGWVIRQMVALKDVFLDAADTPKNVHMAPLIQYRATLVTIRETILDRDGRTRRSKGRPAKNPLQDLLTDDQLTEIAKARKAKNGATAEK